MPTILRWRGYRFFFYSGDRREPPHIHVKKTGAEAKIWLDDVSVARSVDFSQNDLNAIIKLVNDHKEIFRDAWYDFFQSGSS